MAYEVTVDQVITRARRMADAETSTPTTDFVTDAELLVQLNAAYREFVDLVASQGDAALELLATSVELPSPFYLPADFYRLIAVDLPDDTQAGRWVDAKSFNFRDRNRFYGTRPFPRYRLVGGQLVLTPTETAVTTLRIWYVPYVDDLILPVDLLVTYNGWEDYLCSTLASYICAKEDRDTGPHKALRDVATARIAEACSNLVLAGTQTIAQVEWQPEDARGWWW